MKKIVEIFKNYFNLIFIFYILTMNFNKLFKMIIIFKINLNLYINKKNYINKKLL